MHRTAKKARTKEDLLEKAKIVLDDPALRAIIVNAHSAEPSRVVPMIREVIKGFVSTPKIAAGLRYAAMLVRDYPETIRLFTHPNESEKPMSDTKVEQKVLTAADLYNRKRFSFTWGGWTSEFQCLRNPRPGIRARPSEPCSEEFIVRVSFPLRRVDEFYDKLLNIAREAQNFVERGVHFFPHITPSYPDPHHDLPQDHFNKWYEGMRERGQGIPGLSHASVQIGYLDFHFACGPRALNGKNVHCWSSEKFRSIYMLACIQKYFGIPTEEIEYEPLVEEPPMDSKSVPFRSTDEQMVLLLEFLSGTEFTVETVELLAKMLKRTDNLSKPVILDMKNGEGGVSGARVCQEVKGQGGYQLNRFMRLAGSDLYASARITPEGRLKVTISYLEDEDESEFVECKLDDFA